MSKKEQESAQSVMIRKIRESLPATISFADELAELLNISIDSAYRRIRGETAFTIEELEIVCTHFQFSFDAFISNKGRMVSFSYHALNSDINTFKEYLLNMKKDLQQILTLPEQQRQIIFSAVDIPIFHHFAHPFLTAFKIFYWQRSILNTTGFEDKKFDSTHIDPETLQIAGEIYDLYIRINSKEIWSDDTINSTLKQIEFYWDSGAFSSKEDALNVCNETRSMFLRIHKQAELSTKVSKNNEPVAIENNYALYHSDITIGTNCVMTCMGETKYSYLSFHTFNTMLLKSAHFSEGTDAWLKNLISKSNLISGVGTKQRYLFFKKINDSLSRVVEKIEKSETV